MDFRMEANRIYLEDEAGRVIAEINFPEVSEGMVDVNHTFVDASLRGQGVAGKLMAELVGKLRREDRKAVCSCSYAKGWAQKHPEYSDVFLV